LISSDSSRGTISSGVCTHFRKQFTHHRVFPRENRLAVHKTSGEEEFAEYALHCGQERVVLHDNLLNAEEQRELSSVVIVGEESKDCLIVIELTMRFFMHKPGARRFRQRRRRLDGGGHRRRFRVL